ncbi:hypothetical protein FOA52_008221 [Chlamydomonas sp. UWO 241]|nr:hypothetical protein FOA52_008221 [Chlamydomonas sp. UWO 241]
MDVPTCGGQPPLPPAVIEVEATTSAQHHVHNSAPPGETSQVEQPGGSRGAEAAALSPHQVKCWACHVLVEVPLVGESKIPSPVFKCGWCGAVTEYMHMRPKRVETIFRWLMRAIAAMKWFIVAIVLILTASIVIPGAVFLVPVTMSAPFVYVGHFFTWLFAFLTLFNYWSCTIGSPGTVKDCYPMPVTPGQTIHRGAFENWRYCYPCKFYKPPVAHHCNVCNCCVVDMDHHCPFVNNCVGKANLRSFILFLGWAVVSDLYAAGHACAVLFNLQRDVFFQGIIRAWAARRGVIDTMAITAIIFFSMPGHVMAAMWVLGASAAVAAVCAGLLTSSLRHIAEVEYSHIEHRHQRAVMEAVQQGHPPPPATDLKRAKRAAFYAKLAQIMGGGLELRTWLVPSWGPPDGTFAGPEAKKQQ